MNNINSTFNIIKRSIKSDINDIKNWILQIYYTFVMHIWVCGCFIFPPKDEFSKRLDLNAIMAYNLKKKTREYYLHKLMYFRNKAHIRDF